MDAYDKFIALHNADLPQTGFDYQFYNFIYYLLDSEQMDEVVYEGEDDLEVANNGITSLIQVKHSVKASENLTDLDKDLWKTIHNWVEQWDKFDKTNRGSFVNSHRFILLTNKPLKCKFVALWERYMIHEEDEHSVSVYLDTLSSADKEVQNGIDALRSFDKNRLKSFLTHFNVVYESNILKKLCNRVRRIYPSDEISNNVLYQIIGRLHTEKYDKALKRYKLRYVKSDFDHDFRTILQGPTPNLPKFISSFDKAPTIPADYRSMNMLKQLELIEEIDLYDSNDSEVLNVYAMYLHYRRNIDRFILQQLIDQTFVENLEDSAFQIWSRIFSEKSRSIRRYKKTDIDQFMIDKGIECYSETMKQPVGSFDFNFSNGCFLKLSNDNPPMVGWRNDWQSHFTTR